MRVQPLNSSQKYNYDVVSVIVWIGVFLFLIPFPLKAQLSAIGYGSTREEAADQAMSELISQIMVEVTTESSLQLTETNDSIEESFTQNILRRAELPLFGAEFEYTPTQPIKATVSIQSDKARSLYLDQYQTLIQSISTLTEGTELSAMPYDQLQLLANEVEQAAKVRIGALYFGVADLENLPISFAEVRKALLDRSKNFTSLAEAMSYVSSTLGKHKGNVYVFPPMYENSTEITSLAKSIRDQLNISLEGKGSLEKATFFVRGAYRDTDDRLEIALQVINRTNETVDGVLVTLNEKAYEGYVWKPKTTSIDQLIKDGVLISSDLRVQLSTNRGKSDLYFSEGEEVEVLVKTNRSSYLYFVGHNTTSSHAFSYLLPLSEGNGKRDMILFVNADEVNKWISLGKFEVSPPFGVERLQVFAQTTDPIDDLPSYYWNDEGYPEIGKDPNEVVVKTRGLLRKKSSNKKKESAESFLLFTTGK